MNVPRSSPLPPPPPSTAPRSSRTTWIIGGAIAAVVLVAGIVAITTSGDDGGASVVAADSTPEEVEAPATEATSVTTAPPVGPAEPDPAATVPVVTAAPATAAPATAAPVLQQTQPVTVTGSTLPVISDDLAIGATAPEIAGASFDGSPVAIAPGRPTLVVFLAHWCPHCQSEVKVLVDWAASGGQPDGLDVIGVATATTEQRDNYPPSDWLADEGWPWPVLADSPGADALFAMGGDAFPFFVLLDANGAVVARQSGEVDPRELETAIADALG